MDMAYKIYASVLNEKLKKETEDKLRETQLGFRERRGMMDAVYTRNYVVNKELSKRGKIFAFFANLKAMFNKVNRKQMNEMLKKTKIKDNLSWRIMET